MKLMQKWYEIKAQSQPDKPTEVLIYDEIGGWGITAAQFVRDVKALGNGPINVRINSPGGSVFDGLAIYHYLSSRPDVTVTVDGIAASIASIIAMAGSKRVMPASAYLMIHNPWTGAIGEAKDLREQADLLDKLGETLAGIYAKVTQKSKEVIRAMMDAETWIDGTMALSDGFMTDLTDAKPIYASVRADRFACTPTALVQAASPSELMVEDCVTWNDSTGTAYGEIVEIKREGTLELPDAGIVVVASAADPAALVQRHQPIPGTDAFVEGDILVGLNFSQLTKVEGLKIVETEDNADSTHKTMKKLLQSLTAAGLISSVDLAEDTAVTEFETNFANFAKARADAQASLDAIAKAKVVATVDAAIADGRIAAAVKDAWVAQIQADAKASELLAAIQAPKPGSAPVGSPAGSGGKISADLRAEFDRITDPKQRSSFWSANKAQLLQQ
jgi:ATP-dependent Clp endopeptidase proteolytic subunit ClpP